MRTKTITRILSEISEETKQKVRDAANSLVIKPIHKFNNGRGATLCHCCSKIINTGFTQALYCNEICDRKHNVKANWDIKEYYEQMDKEVHQNRSNLNK